LRRSAWHTAGKARGLQGSVVTKLRFLKASSHEPYVWVQCSRTDEMSGVDGVHVVDVTTRDDVIVGCVRFRINKHEDKETRLRGELKKASQKR
jgi:hypothetical protein